jgi:hypothetical protein
MAPLKGTKRLIRAADDIIRDTQKLVAKLQQHGFSSQQAEGITQALRDLGLATKSDLQDLKVDLMRWMVGTQLAYGAIVVAVLVALR